MKYLGQSTNNKDLVTKDLLPAIATTATAGLVKPDGTTITIDANGVISSSGGGGGGGSPVTMYKSVADISSSLTTSVLVRYRLYVPAGSFH